MDFKIDKSALALALGPCVDVSDPANSLPICGHVALETQGTGLRIRATRLEQYAVARVDAEVKADGAACVSAKALAAAVAKMPAGDLRIAEAKGGIEITSGKTRVRLPAMGAEDFPATPVPDDAAWIEVPGDALRHALAVAYAAHTDPTRAAMAGVRIEIEGRHLWGIATDGSRIAIGERSVPEGLPALAFTIPSAALKPIGKAIASAETVRLAVQPPTLTLDLGALVLATKLADEGFPPWRSIMSRIESQPSRVRVRRAALLDALDRVSLVVTAGEKAEKGGADFAYAAAFTVADGVLHVSAKSARLGEVADEIAVDLEGPEPERIGLSPSYMKQALGQCSDDVVSLCLADAQGPAVVRGEGVTCVVMPMRGV